MNSIKFEEVCVCGLCNHRVQDDCVGSECKCCLNFHIRSGITETA